MRTGLVLAAAAVIALSGCIGSADLDELGDANATAEAFVPWPAIDEADIRPGVNIVDGSCTSNFLFQTPDNQTLFLGTAAHCVSEKEIGDPVTIADGLATGTLAYSSFIATGEEGTNDFALVELPDSAREEVHPAMFAYGGPTGIATSVSPGDKLYAYGNSTLRPDEAPDEAGPREGYVTHHDEEVTGAYFAGPGVPGDSGSAVTTADGAALGTLITLEIAPQAGSNNVANLAFTLDEANSFMDREVQLVTWPMTGEGDLPSPNDAKSSSTGPTSILTR